MSCNTGVAHGSLGLKIFFLLWMKKIHYPNTIRSHLVTIVPLAPFTPKSISKVEICFAL